MLTCYLDSQDYSILTDPKKLNSGLEKIRSKLLEFSSSREVKFVFSIASVSEIVATSENATGLALKRAELLSKLCGSNALISIDRLLNLELQNLYKRAGPSEHVIDPQGNWFPNISEIIDENSSSDIVEEVVNQELNQPGLSRKERRAKEGKLLRNGKPRAKLIKRIDEMRSKATAKALIEQFPMKPEFADVITRYCAGRATEHEFREAFLSTLRDITYMMQWFTTNFALSSPIAEIVRDPGRELGIKFRQIIEKIICRADELKVNRVDVNPTGRGGLISDHWSEAIDFHLVSVINLAARENNIQLDNIDVQLIEKYCPGAATYIKALFRSAWANIGGGRNKLFEDSQPVDTLHAMYAPYVKVFRADRFMSPHIQAQVKHRGIIVVPKLEELVDVLEKERQIIAA